MLRLCVFTLFTLALTGTIGCGGGGSGLGPNIFNTSTSLFPGLPDTNANGIPEAGRGTAVQIHLDLAAGLDCSPNDNPVQNAQLSYNVSAGGLDTANRNFVGNSALCQVEGFMNTWNVPNAPGIYALSVNVTVNRDNGRTDTDSLLRQIEVF